MSKGREIDEETILLEMQPGAGSEEPCGPSEFGLCLVSDGSGPDLESEALR